MKKTDELLLANLILRGLSRVSVEENPRRVGVERSIGRRAQADILGLALIGEFGVRKAIDICRPVCGNVDEVIREVASRLGINRTLLKTVEEKHANATTQISARAIAEELKLQARPLSKGHGV